MITHFHLKSPESLFKSLNGKNAKDLFFKSDLFAPRPILVAENSPFQNWFRLYAAREWGVVLGLDTMGPNNLFHELAKGYRESPFQEDGGPGLPFQDKLQMRVLEILDDLIGKGFECDGKWDLLKNYLDQSEFGLGSPDPMVDARRRYDFARDVAQAFYDYAFMAKRTLADLKSGVDSTRQGLLPWQIELWNRIFHPVDGGPDIRLPFDVVEEAEARGWEKPVASVLLCWDPSTWSPALRSLLKAYGKKHEVYFLSLAFKGEPHSLAATWQPAASVPGAVEVDPIPAPAKGLDALSLLREKIFQPPSPDKLEPPDDLSSSAATFTVHGAHGHRRQVEVLHNVILHLLKRHETWGPQDIAVAVPDVSEWAPFLMGTFARPVGDGGRLNLVFTEGDVGELPPVLSLWQDLLALPLGPFGREEILAILANPCHRTATSEGAETLRELFAEAHGTWGYDKHDRANQGIDDDHGTLQNAWLRVARGMAFGGEAPGRVAVPSSTLLETAGRAGVELDRLYAIRETLRRGSMTADAWAAWARTHLVSSIRPRESAQAEDEKHIERLGLALSEFTEAARDGKRTSPMTGAEFALWLQRYGSETARPWGKALVTGVTVASLRRLAGVPFRATILLGFGAGKYPGVKRRPAWDFLEDLTKEENLPRPEDHEKAAFLAALMTGGSEFHVIYPGRDLMDNHPMRPALLVEDLIACFKNDKASEWASAADKGGTFKSIEIIHPLLPHDARYFQEKHFEAGLFNYNVPDLAVQKAVLEAKPGSKSPVDMVGKIPDMPADEKGELTLSVSRLEKLVKSPFEMHYQEAYGSTLGGDDEEGEDSRTEHWTPDNLAQHRIFSAMQAGGDMPTLLMNLEKEGLLHGGWLGESTRRDAGKIAGIFDQKRRELAPGAEHRRLCLVTPEALANRLAVPDKKSKDKVCVGPVFTVEHGGVRTEVRVVGDIDGIWWEGDTPVLYTGFKNSPSGDGLEALDKSKYPYVAVWETFLRLTLRASLAGLALDSKKLVVPFLVQMRTSTFVLMPGPVQENSTLEHWCRQCLAQRFAPAPFWAEPLLRLVPEAEGADDGKKSAPFSFPEWALELREEKPFGGHTDEHFIHYTARLGFDDPDRQKEVFSTLQTWEAQVVDFAARLGNLGAAFVKMAEDWKPDGDEGEGDGKELGDPPPEPSGTPGRVVKKAAKKTATRATRKTGGRS